MKTKKFLKMAGYDTNKPRDCTERIITQFVNSAVPSVMSKQEMVNFLEDLIKKLEK